MSKGGSNDLDDVDRNEAEPGYTQTLNSAIDLIDEVIGTELRRGRHWSILHCWWPGTGSGGAC